jgi:hypothetical protein
MPNESLNDWVRRSRLRTKIGNRNETVTERLLGATFRHGTFQRHESVSKNHTTGIDH